LGAVMGNKLICALVFAVASIEPGVVNAAYVIKLKNGNEFITGRYWHNGRQVLFETFDGIFGVDKAFVSKVEKSDKPVRLITRSAAEAELKPIETNDKNSEEAKKNPVENQDKVQAKRDENDPILRHFQSIKERAKNVDGMLTTELNQLVKDLADLKRAMQLGGKTEEFLAEFGELHDIADRVEDALKRRR
jgi:hypothetical protein